MQILSTFLCAVLFSCVGFSKPIKILMIDAGLPVRFLETKGKHLTDYYVYHNHSTAMYKFIVSGKEKGAKLTCENVIVDSCEFLDKNNQYNEAKYHYCLKKANTGDYDIVNMSLSGGIYDVMEHMYITSIKRHSLIVIAAGNNGVDYREYPSAYATTKTGPVFAISAIDSNGDRLKFSNKDKLTIDFIGEAWYNLGFMQGTSVAAALFTNDLIKRMCQ